MINNILFDFDGVILDSMPIRDYGFKKIFEEFDDDLVDRLIDYHNENGGLSRYMKIKYFYNQLLGKNISEQEIKKYADSFSEIMKKELVNKKYLIDDTLEFIKSSFNKYNLHVVSGSDQEELLYLCRKLVIEDYFQSIHGSPTHKNQLVKDLLENNKYLINETILIGDSINDYEAAKDNGLDFFGFNNTSIINLSKHYLKSYKRLL